MKDQSAHLLRQSYNLAALFSLSLRIVAGWTYFSAFWRRVALADKLDPDGAGYIGEKFNHFLPNALGIGPFIEYLVTNPDILWWFMVVFTIIEGVVGLLFMFGFFTRLMSIGVFCLALGILLGAGWLGTTCLDEWQIGVLGIAAGFTVFLSGGGRYSLDHLVFRSGRSQKKWMLWTCSDELPLSERSVRSLTLGGTALIVLLTLFTNQYFHGGIWGNLHNLSIRPNVVISNTSLQDQELHFTVYRNEGADVYGSFLIKASLKSGSGEELLTWDAQHLSKLPASAIQNDHIAKVRPGKHSLVIPLGAKATLRLAHPELDDLQKGAYVLELTDISGLTWTEKVEVR